MNLVQRMVAENRQSVTSQELAEAAGMTHEDLCQMISEYRSKFEEIAALKVESDGYTLDVNQAFFAVSLLPMDEEALPTPSDELKADLKASFIKVFSTRRKAARERAGA